MRLWSNCAPLFLAVFFVSVWAVGPGRAQGPRPAPASGPMEAAGFRLPDYHPDGTLKSEMFGETATIDGDRITIWNLRVEVYEAGRLATSFWGEQCRYDRKTGWLTSDTPVRVIRAGLLITGDGMDWEKGETVVTLRRNVRVTTVRSMGWMKAEKRP